MNGWKERLIKYIEALDESISPEEAEKLVLTEMDQIKKEASAKAQEHLTAEIVDNRNQLNKSIGMSELVALYRELFYGRQDVFAVRWDNEKAGTHGYAPKCKNEWDRNICGKSMRIKGACKKCAYKENQEITDQFIQQHFTGTGRNALVMGVYPLLEDETCRFLAIDFDKKNWQEEILIAKSIYTEYGIKSYIERSCSGNGGHLWIFFSEPIEARLARKLGTKVLETAINRTGSSKFDSFDRLFPNQDYMPKSGYGNLIALPLQRQAVEKGNSVFVDDTFKMYSSQTAVLQNIVRYGRSEILDVLKLFPDVVLQEVSDKELAEEDRTLPWEKKKEEKVPTDLPKSIDVVLYDKNGLTATLKRKDGKERIVLMQLGPVRYKDLSKVTSGLRHKVLAQETGIGMDNSKAEYTTNEIYDYLYSNPIRNTQILMDVRNCLDEKRYPIILTERKEHIELQGEELSHYVKVYKLHGGLKRKEREAIMEELHSLPETEKRVIIATSKYVGEGFDYPILDTLFLTLPISWSGRVKQYAGRLHREYHEKKEVRIYDYVDSKVEPAMKMYGKRCKGYRSMGYEIVEK